MGIFLKTRRRRQMFSIFFLGFIALGLGKPVEEVDDPEYGDLFEGDIVLPEGQLFEDLKVGPYNAIIGDRYRWPNNIVPYRIDPDSGYSSSQISQIEDGVATLNSQTAVNGVPCINIKPRNGESDYVTVYKGGGCSSNVGRIGGQQRLSLANGCLRKGTIMHEFLHALGFFHEQSRGDRDDFVYINYDNIRPGRENNFRKQVEGVSIDHLGTPYDYGSCMHYGAFAFAVDRSIPTIVPLQEGEDIGQRVQLSTQDIQRVRNLYCPRLVQ